MSESRISKPNDGPDTVVSVEPFQLDGQDRVRITKRDGSVEVFALVDGQHVAVEGAGS